MQDIESWQECAQACINKRCQFWSYSISTRLCTLREGNMQKWSHADFISGLKGCAGMEKPFADKLSSS